MIVDLFVTAFLGVLDALLSLIPSFTLPDLPNVFTTDLGASLAVADGFVPIEDALIIVGIGLAYAIWSSLAHFVVWVYHQFWGSD